MAHMGSSIISGVANGWPIYGLCSRLVGTCLSLNRRKGGEVFGVAGLSAQSRAGLMTGHKSFRCLAGFGGKERA
jgi:hypothetical protein